MDIIKIRKYLCIACKKSEIVERMTEHTYEGEIPDQNNCDLSSYSGHVVIGGKLLLNRPSPNWQLLSVHLINIKSGPSPTPPEGGICEDCLKDDTLYALATTGHIRFASPDDLRKSRHS